MSAFLEQARALSIEERMQLVEDICESINEEEAKLFPAPDLAELDRRSAELHANPSLGIPWSAAKEMLLKDEA